MNHRSFHKIGLSCSAATLIATLVSCLSASPLMANPIVSNPQNPYLGICRVAMDPGPSPFIIPLESTGDARGASGVVTMRFAPSPFGVALTVDGHFRYQLSLSAEGLNSVPGKHHVAWAATPELDQVTRLGALSDAGVVEGEVSYNKILVFVTEESSPEGTTWSGPVLLRGVSRSGLLHTMAGHGPFNDAPCF